MLFVSHSPRIYHPEYYHDPHYVLFSTPLLPPPFDLNRILFTLCFFSLLVPFVLSPLVCFPIRINTENYVSYTQMVGLFERVIGPVPRSLPTQGNTNTQEARIYSVSIRRVEFEPMNPVFERAKVPPFRTFIIYMLPFM
jgi:hypothetical protein